MTCVICAAGQPAGTIAELESGWLAAATGPVALPGYAAYFTKKHVTEPYELPEPERGVFWHDVSEIAKTLAEVFTPSKMNYEIHGNTIPHLHVHFFPRFRGDPFEGRPIAPSETRYERTAADLGDLMEALHRSPRVRRILGNTDSSDHPQPR